MKILLLVLVLLVPAIASAQAIDGYRLNIYAAGAPAAATPTTFFDIPNAAVTCNVAPPAPTTGPPVNPTRGVWDDPNNAGRTCQWTDSGAGPLFAIPVGGTYEATLQAFNAAGRGPESNRAPFTRASAPASAPTGFRLIRLGS